MAKPILKTPEEIERMEAAGRVVAKALRLIQQMIAPGITTRELDRAVEELIRKEGGIPAFLGYPSPTAGVPPFPASICVSIDEEVVHGIPSDRRLREGEIVSVDVGVNLGGFFGDAAWTFPVGTISRKARRLIETAELCLKKAIASMRPGGTIQEIARAIQQTAESAGYAVVKQFVGHGIGRAMHEPPQVPNYVTRDVLDGRTALSVGTTLAIEPMINMGKSEVRVCSDGWTVITKDRTLSAHVEHTVALTAQGPKILTAW